jgi:hypothetical protein
MNWEVHFASSRQVLDIAVPAVFRSSRNGACSFTADFLFDFSGSRTSVDVCGIGGLGDNAIELVGCYEFAFTFIPGCEDLGRRSTA